MIGQEDRWVIATATSTNGKKYEVVKVVKWGSTTYFVKDQTGDVKGGFDHRGEAIKKMTELSSR